jgi:hypothetical protein
MRYIILCFILVLAACAADRIARLEKETKELRSEMERRKRLTDLDTQAKCSAAAKTFFKEEWGRPDRSTILLNYTNHYNGALGKCFILVEWHYNEANSKDGAWFSVAMLHDVFENNKYAEVSERHSVTYGDNPDLQVTVLRCTVDGVKCKNADEFAKNTQHYMAE